MSYTSSKLTKPLTKRKFTDPAELPNRAEVITYFARAKHNGKPCYPPGWRKLLNLPFDFMREVGGLGELPVEYITWQMREAQ